MKKLNLLLLCFWCSIQTVQAKPNVEGEYHVNGGSVYILPEQNFVFIGYAIVLTGKYEIKNDVLHFKVARLNEPQIIINEFHDLDAAHNQDMQKPKANQIFIQFDSELSNNLYIGVNQKGDHAHLKKIINDEANCFEYDSMNKIFDRQKHNSIILYQEKSEDSIGFMKQYQIPDQVNRLEIRSNKNELIEKPFEAKIRNLGLVFDNKNLVKPRPLSEVSEENLYLVNQIIQQKHQLVSFESQPIKLTNILLDKQPILNFLCEN